MAAHAELEYQAPPMAVFFFANPSAVLPSLLPLYGVFPLFDSLDLADMKMFCIFAGVNKTEIKTYK
jgi:hypothetical protein